MSELSPMYPIANFVARNNSRNLTSDDFAGYLGNYFLDRMKARHWRTLTVFSAALLIALVGFSRIALGAHYLTDVIAAMFFGSLWLAFCLFAGKPMRKTTLPDPVAATLPVVGEVGLVPVPVTQTKEPAQVIPS
jgi:hypothetical protein